MSRNLRNGLHCLNSGTKKILMHHSFIAMIEKVKNNRRTPYKRVIQSFNNLNSIWMKRFHV